MAQSSSTCWLTPQRPAVASAGSEPEAPPWSPVSFGHHLLPSLPHQQEDGSEAQSCWDSSKIPQCGMQVSQSLNLLYHKCWLTLLLLLFPQDRQTHVWSPHPLVHFPYACLGCPEAESWGFNPGPPSTSAITWSCLPRCVFAESDLQERIQTQASQASYLLDHTSLTH